MSALILPTGLLAVCGFYYGVFRVANALAIWWPSPGDEEPEGGDE